MRRRGLRGEDHPPYAGFQGLGAARGREQCAATALPEGTLTHLAVDVCYHRSGKLGPAVRNDAEAFEALKALVPYAFEDAKEGFYTLLLNTKHRIIGIHQVVRGGCATCSVLPREAFQAALALSATTVLFVHNHPSGDTTFSADDLALTGRLKKAGNELGIKVLDHFVIALDEDRMPLYRSMVLDGHFATL